MTTIAWRDGVIASDRQGTHGSTAGKCTKLLKTQSHAIGVCGSLAYGIAFKDWFAGDRKGECPLTQESDTYALVMDLKTGVCELWEAPGVGIPVEEEWIAIGSGMDFAKSAMLTGATAKDAVKIASKLDIYSGLGVTTIKAKHP